MDKNAIWDMTPPHLHINCSLHVWGRVQGSQIFKQNSIISICSKVIAFLVILLSPRGPHVVLALSPRHPHIIPTSSPCHPHHPHIVPIAPRRSPCGPHGLWSLVSTCCPCCPNVIPTLSPSSPRCLRHPHIIPIAPRRSHVVSMVCGLVVPMSSLSSPHHPRVVPIIPTLSP